MPSKLPEQSHLLATLPVMEKDPLVRNSQKNLESDQYFGGGDGRIRKSKLFLSLQ